MKGPVRFKSARNPGLEGRLLAAAFEQRPEPASVKRTAERLGLPAGLFAVSAATVVESVASPAAAATVTAGKVAILGGLGVVGTTKAVIVGVSIGVGIAVGATALHLGGSNRIGARPSLPQVVSKPATRDTPVSTTVGESDVVQPAPTPQTSTTARRIGPSQETSTPELEAAAPSRAQSGAPIIGRFDDIGAEPAHVSRDALLSERASPTAPALQAANATASVPAALDPRIAREVASLDRARGLARRGDAAAALAEVDGFARHFGYSALSLEAQFVRIDALVALGRRTEAARLAAGLPWDALSTSQRQRLSGLVGDAHR